MNQKTFTIGVLSVTALILSIAQFLPVQPAMAQNTIRDRNYSLVTARASNGGDVVYVIRNNTGQIASFVWDTSKRALVVSSIRNMTDVFNQQ